MLGLIQKLLKGEALDTYMLMVHGRSIHKFLKGLNILGGSIGPAERGAKQSVSHYSVKQRVWGRSALKLGNSYRVFNFANY